MTEDSILWLTVIALLIVGAFFSSSETAFAASNVIRLKVKADQGNDTAKKAVRFIERFEDTVIISVVGNNLVSVALSSIATLFFIEIFGDLGQGSLYATIASTVAFYLFCDTFPKSIARALPEAIALINTQIFSFFEWLFAPVTYVLHGIIWLLNRLVKAEPESRLTEQDFTQVLDTAQKQGSLQKDESDLIRSALKFDDTMVKEVLTPLDEIVALDLSKYDGKALSQFLANTRYSRIPIYRGNVQNIIGILTVRNYFKSWMANPTFDVKKILTKPYFVSAKVLLDDLFEGFQRNQTHIAIVLDESKHPIGLVTLADILEEIVGKMNEASSKGKEVNRG